MTAGDDFALLYIKIGPLLLSRILGVEKATTVVAWMESGQRVSNAEHDEKLRLTADIVRLFPPSPSPRRVRTWLEVQNAALAGRSPAQALVEGLFDDVLLAARAHLRPGPGP